MDGGIVDRSAETKENEEVDRVGVTIDPDEVDRTGATQEDASPAIIIHIHPVSEEKSALLLGFKEPKLESSLMSFKINQELIFGRGEDVALLFNDPSASRRHMELKGMLTPSSTDSYPVLQFTIKKLTKQPLKVNNNDLRAGEERILKSLDVVQIGQNTFTVEINPNNMDNNNMKYLLEVKLPMAHAPNPPQPMGLLNNAGIVSGTHQQMNSSHGIVNSVNPITAQNPQFMTFAPSGLFVQQQPAFQMQQQGTALMQPGMLYQTTGIPMQPGIQWPPGMQIQHGMQVNSPGMPVQLHGMPVQPQPMPAQPQGIPVSQPVHYNTANTNGNHSTPWSSVSDPSFPSNASQRRDAFHQSTGQMPSENDEALGRPRNVSIEETEKHPNQTSFEETQSPKH